MSAHPKEVKKYSGKWVAIAENGIAAFGDSVSEIEAALKKKNMTLGEVMVMKVPRKDEELSIL